MGDGRRDRHASTAAATGWSAPTAACSASATRTSTARPATFPLAQPVNSIAPTRSGHGYWLLAWDGGVFSFGDAKFFGSTGGMRLNSPVDEHGADADGQGVLARRSRRWRVQFRRRQVPRVDGRQAPRGSPVVGIAPTPTGKGYWMVASDGGIFSFGDAHFYGSLGPDGTAVTDHRDGRDEDRSRLLDRARRRRSVRFRRRAHLAGRPGRPVNRRARLFDPNDRQAARPVLEIGRDLLEHGSRARAAARPARSGRAPRRCRSGPQPAPALRPGTRGCRSRR